MKGSSCCLSSVGLSSLSSSDNAVGSTAAEGRRERDEFPRQAPPIWASLISSVRLLHSTYHRVPHCHEARASARDDRRGQTVDRSS